MTQKKFVHGLLFLSLLLSAKVGYGADPRFRADRRYYAVHLDGNTDPIQIVERFWCNDERTDYIRIIIPCRDGGASNTIAIEKSKFGHGAILNCLGDTWVLKDRTAQ
jgi:hypothetical protein